MTNFAIGSTRIDTFAALKIRETEGFLGAHFQRFRFHDTRFAPTTQPNLFCL
jgi:hypothetical protein